MKNTHFLKPFILGLSLVMSACLLPAFSFAETASQAEIDKNLAELGLDEDLDLDLDETPKKPEASLSDQVADLKQQMIELNRDLFILEEDLLFPASTQVAVYVSLDVGEYFALDSVQLVIDDQKVSAYLYTQKEVAALKRGGIQRLYVGNLKLGEHKITALFTGVGPQKRTYKRGANYTLKKTTEPSMVELHISDSQSKNQPEFTIREWK